jgi:penicillin-binding protein 1A
MAKSDGKSGDGRKKGSRRPFRLFPVLLRWSIAAAVWVVAGVTLLLGWYAVDLPDVDQALSPVRRPAITLLTADGSELKTYGDAYRRPVTLAELPPALPAAVLATEDRRFYDHFGVDLIALVRATLANLRTGQIVQGGSTISQQAAKNLFLTSERTFKRKIQELMLAIWLEHRFTKEQILTIYLNRVYLGAGTYGVEAAALRYFDKPAKDLTIYESAMLAGLLKAPSRYSPAANPDLATQRALQVLDNMVDAGALTEAQAEVAKRQRAIATRSTESIHFARHFTDWVMERLPGYVPVGTRDLIVTTTLDKRLQKAAEVHTDALLDDAGAKVGASEAALVSLAPDGAVVALVGGHDYGRSQFNRATQALRQPGSAFKLFVYLAALEAGYTPQTRVLDAPISVDGWTPGNFDGKFRGDVSLLDAFSQSLNTATVRVIQRVTPQRVVAVAQRLGITSELLPSPSLALGTSEASLLEMTAAYGVFANGGMGVWPYAIREVKDTAGNVLYRRTGSGPGLVVLGAQVQQMADMMAEVMASGTGKTARIERPAAGKTGTTQNFRDAWFIGYTADYVTGVWVGNDDNAPMKRVSGGSLPAMLWKRYMTSAEIGHPLRPLPMPAPAVAEAPLPSLVGGQPPQRQASNDDGFWSRLLAPIFNSSQPTVTGGRPSVPDRQSSNRD